MGSDQPTVFVLGPVGLDFEIPGRKLVSSTGTHVQNTSVRNDPPVEGGIAMQSSPSEQVQDFLVCSVMGEVGD